MNRWIVCGIVGLLGVAAAAAQPEMRPGASHRQPLQGEAKFRWITERLNLTAEQATQVDAFITLYQADIEEVVKNQTEILRRMQVVYAEIDKAKADGNDARVRELQAQLSQMGPEATADKKFYDNLVQVLTDEQKARLPELQEQVRTAHVQAPPPPTAAVPPPPAAAVAPATGGMRPYHVVAATVALGLSAEEHNQLEQVLDEFRTKMRVEPPRKEEDFADRLEALIKSIRPILSAEHGAQFDLDIAALRRGAPDAVPFVMPVGPVMPAVAPAPRTPPAEAAKAPPGQ